MTYGRKERSCTVCLDHFHLITSINEAGQGHEIDQIPGWLWISPHVTAILTVLKLFCFAELLSAFSLSQHCPCCMHILLIFSIRADHIHWNDFFFLKKKERLKKFLHFCSLLLKCGKCFFGFHCKVSKSDVTGGRDSKQRTALN